MNFRNSVLAIAVAIAAGCLPGAITQGRAAPAGQPSTFDPDAMAVQPDPHDFVTRTDSGLNTLGNPLRFAGAGLDSLALRFGPAGVDVPTEYEVTDLLATVQAMGMGFARAVSVGASAGCAECVMPARGVINKDALRRADHILRLARDTGIRLVIPLAGGSDACPEGTAVDPIRDTACVFARWRGLPPDAFYTDPGVRADFAAYVVAILQHVNAETGLPYSNDPTIVAWENCDNCGSGVDPAVLADWTEFLGRTIKQVDTRHLYENGAFAGRLDKVGAARLALPTVDVLGDRIAGTPDAGPTRFRAALDAVTGANRAYLIDSYDWSQATWRTPDDLQAFIDALYHDRRSVGAFVSDIYGHAQQGGYVAPPRGGPTPMYFPGFAIAGMDAESVRSRDRAVRKFSYRMEELNPIAYFEPKPPEIISVQHGVVRWRGSAGAMTYSIARTGDLTATNSWETVCDKCAADTSPVWQDVNVPSGPSWYRITPYNINDHQGLPSLPVANR
jgi:hypothetical protein